MKNVNAIQVQFYCNKFHPTPPSYTVNASLSTGHLNASCKRSPAASEMTIAAGTATFAPCLVAAQITLWLVQQREQLHQKWPVLGCRPKHFSSSSSNSNCIKNGLCCRYSDFTPPCICQTGNAIIGEQMVRPGPACRSDRIRNTFARRAT